MQSQNINYHQIFLDIVTKKFPHKKKSCLPLLDKVNLSATDIIRINRIIFGADKKNDIINQRHRSYSKADILQMLNYQQKHKFNNSQLAEHFKLSRNTVAKWKKMFLV